MNDGSIFEELYKSIREALDPLCPICGGSGKVKAMQRLALFGGGSVRGPDVEVQCPYCKGKGKT